MSRLAEALDRLERALARLEAACGEAGMRGAGEAEAQRRRAATDQIAAHVEGALDRVGRVLGG